MILTRASYKDCKKYTGFCLDCSEPAKVVYGRSDAFLRGWFESHILDTGHRVEVTVEEIEGIG